MASREHALLRHTWNSIIPRLSTEAITSSVRGCEKHLRTAYIHFLADLAWVLRCSLACFVKTHYLTLYPEHLTIHLATVILDSENRGIKTNTLVLNLLQCLAGLFSPTCKMDEIPAMVAAGDFGRLCCFGGGDTSGADVDDTPAFVLSLVVTVAPT